MYYYINSYLVPFFNESDSELHSSDFDRINLTTHTPTDPLVWRRNVSSAFLMIFELNQSSGASKVTDHVHCVSTS